MWKLSDDFQPTLVMWLLSLLGKQKNFRKLLKLIPLF